MRRENGPGDMYNICRGIRGKVNRSKWLEYKRTLGLKER